MIYGKTNTTLERQARRVQDSYRSSVGVLAAVQEQNMKLARYSAGMLLEEAEKQREFVQTALEGSFKFYATLLYAPFYSPKNGTFGESGDLDLPMDGYDELAAGEIVDRLDELSAEEVEELKAYEKKNKNRHTVVERLDRSLV